jgi:hypothetical protein
MESFRALEQHGLGFGNFDIRDAAIDGAERRAFFVIEEADTFSAFLGRDVIDVLSEWRMAHAIKLPWLTANVDRVVRATREARVAVDALLGDYSRHRALTLAASRRRLVEQAR